MGRVKVAADEHGLTFGPVNSNTFQDQKGQAITLIVSNGARLSALMF